MIAQSAAPLRSDWRACVGGRVLDQRALPRTRLNVAAWSPQAAGRQWRARLRPDGRYLFLDLPPGPYIVHAVVDAAGWTGWRMTLAADQGDVRVAPPDCPPTADGPWCALPALRVQVLAPAPDTLGILPIKLASDLAVGAFPADSGAGFSARAAAQLPPDGGLGP